MTVVIVYAISLLIRSGNIWVGSSDGALSFKEDFKDPESIVFHLYARIPDDMNCLSNNNVYRVVTTSQGEVYLATFGGGLNQLVSMNGEGELYLNPIQ